MYLYCYCIYLVVLLYLYVKTSSIITVFNNYNNNRLMRFLSLQSLALQREEETMRVKLQRQKARVVDLTKELETINRAVDEVSHARCASSMLQRSLYSFLPNDPSREHINLRSSKLSSYSERRGGACKQTLLLTDLIKFIKKCVVFGKVRGFITVSP